VLNRLADSNPVLLLPGLCTGPSSWLTLNMCSTLLSPATSSRCLLLHAKLNTGHPVDTTCDQAHHHSSDC
jgi:hypothetical protein